MRRGDATREHIVQQAASLFNQKGFSGASVVDIMEATGLKKGGIYRHFETKEALAIEAFGYSVARMRTRFVDAQAGRSNPVDRLRAIISVFSDLQEHPAVPGGCPIMNAAIDSHDGNALLRLRARVAMDGLRRLVRSNLEQAVTAGKCGRTSARTGSPW